MRLLLRGSPTRLGAWAVVGLLGVLSLGLAGSASAYSYGHGYDGWGGHGEFDLPGISLKELIDDEGSFSSKNGEVTFSGFEADTSGIAPKDLDFYRLFPTTHGFKIFTPLLGFAGEDAALSLTYDVDAAEGLLIDSVGISFKGMALFGRSETKADYLDGSGESLADLIVWKGKNFRDHAVKPHRSGGDDWGHHGWKHGRRFDYARLSEAVAGLTVEEMMSVETGLFAKNLFTKHKFKTVPIPEPTTALLLGLGLAGLGYAGRRRS